MKSLAERLEATGPEPLSVLREAEEQVTRLEAQGVSLMHGIVTRNRTASVADIVRGLEATLVTLNVSLT